MQLKKTILKILLTANLLLLSVALIGQNVQKLFNSLKVPLGWHSQLVITKDFNSFYEGNKDYKIGLITLTARNRFVEFMIFNKDALRDSSFNSQLEQENAETSCRNYHVEPGQLHMIHSFSTSDFFIFPALCPKCNFSNDRQCKKLTKKVTKWMYLNYRSN